MSRLGVRTGYRHSCSGREKQRASMPVSGNWKRPDSTAGSCGQATSSGATGPQGSYCTPYLYRISYPVREQLQKRKDWETLHHDIVAIPHRSMVCVLQLRAAMGFDLGTSRWFFFFFIYTIDCLIVYLNFFVFTVRSWQSRNHQSVQSNQHRRTHRSSIQIQS